MSIDKNMTIVFNPNQFTVGTSYRQHPSYPKLGHRIIYINSQNDSIPFGKVGTVTGIYKSKIEVMFDQAFIGASNLCGRCNFFRGAVVSLYEIFNLSAWKPFVNLKKDVVVEAGQTPGKVAVTEWNGKLDGYLLMDQILQIKREAGDDNYAGFKLEEGGDRQGYQKKFFRNKDTRKGKQFDRKPRGEGGKDNQKFEKDTKKQNNDQQDHIHEGN